MKKSLALAATAIVFGGIFASAAPAMATPQPVAPVITISSTAIENGGALTISFDQELIPAGFCIGFTQAGEAPRFGGPGEPLPTITFPAGTANIFNTNVTSTMLTNTLSVYPVTADCSVVTSEPVSSEAWTVAPRLTVAIPADFTVGTPASESVAVNLKDNLQGQYLNIPLAAGAHWEVVPGISCEPSNTVSRVATPTYVALPSGITIDPTVSAANTTPKLRFAGTATADEIGSYKLCLNLVGSDANPFSIGYATTTLNIVPAIDPPAAVVPALANTGLDSSGLISGGAGAVALGLGLVALLRRRKATV